MSRSGVRLALLGVLVPSIAAAQPAGAEDLKSEGGATTLAVAGTIGSLLVMWGGIEGKNTPLFVAGLAGFGVGPSLGHLYAGAHKHAAISTGIRAAGIGAILLGARLVDSEATDDTTITVFIGTGIALGICTTAVDLMTADNAARDANARALMIAPTVVSTPNGAIAPGIGLAGRF